MKVLQETTKWAGNTPNHIYYVDDSRKKLFAYFNVVTKRVVRLKTPMTLETRNRTFKELKGKL